MTTTTLNVELLNKVLDLIDDKPHKWQQGSWIDGYVDQEVREAFEQGRYTECGTQACVAGWAVLLAGKLKPQIGRYGRQLVGFLDNDGGEVASPRFQAEELLGIDVWQAHYVFLDMPYDKAAPHTFTDQVRVFFGLPAKWGTDVTFTRKEDCDVAYYRMLLTRAAGDEDPGYVGDWL
jgi:hypothetical protein